ncbi:hypothetical protein BDN72DRAFT_842495 [Pluteus cervinus]|uniref:Uncharacterized protein n=1 Tax=Pluteus cervinus TaxID=181527 RepID=A0ACD3AQ30_9AGAR|nr:hypothetical protein BDN72DRAFT_842495 [Pluteus cervinus]
MTDAHTARLCTRIIYSHFGSLASQVSSVLLARGRLSLSQLVRYTSLRPRVIRASLLGLIQHNLIWHSQGEHEDEEIVELNVEECLLRLRFGHFVWLAEKLLGPQAAEIIQIVLDHGKLQPPEILSKIVSSNSEAYILYVQALLQLVVTAHLKPSTTLCHLSPQDKLIKYEAEEKAKIPGLPSAKALREAKEAAEARVKLEEHELTKVGLKQAAMGKRTIHRSQKRQAEEVDEVDDAVFFRVNPEKFNIHIRNALIEKASTERYNEGAARVLRAVLSVTQPRQLKLSDVRSDPISVASVVMQLADEEGAATGLIFGSKKVPQTTWIKEYLGILSSSDNPTPAGKEASFVTFGSSKVQVEFEVIGRRLRRRILESVTRERYGKEGLRVLRLLLDAGKLDEKQISKAVMMAPKDVRPLLAAMTADFLVSTQEIAKSSDRNPARTFYLWYVDSKKAYSIILGQFYKTLYNICMRMQSEEEQGDVRAVLEKTERSDVRQDESLLTRLERDILAEWRLKQEKLIIMQLRVDEAVFVLRDLSVYGADQD